MNLHRFLNIRLLSVREPLIIHKRFYNDNVIILGDFNDELTDQYLNNVFLKNS